MPGELLSYFQGLDIREVVEPIEVWLFVRRSRKQISLGGLDFKNGRIADWIKIL